MARPRPPISSAASASVSGRSSGSPALATRSARRRGTSASGRRDGVRYPLPPGSCPRAFGRDGHGTLRRAVHVRVSCSGAYSSASGTGAPAACCRENDVTQVREREVPELRVTWTCSRREPVLESCELHVGAFGRAAAPVPGRRLPAPVVRGIVPGLASCTAQSARWRSPPSEAISSAVRRSAAPTRSEAPALERCALMVEHRIRPSAPLASARDRVGEGLRRRRSAAGSASRISSTRAGDRRPTWSCARRASSLPPPPSDSPSGAVRRRRSNRCPRRGRGRRTAARSRLADDRSEPEGARLDLDERATFVRHGGAQEPRSPASGPPHRRRTFGAQLRQAHLGVAQRRGAASRPGDVSVEPGGSMGAVKAAISSGPPPGPSRGGPARPQARA